LAATALLALGVLLGVPAGIQGAAASFAQETAPAVEGPTAEPGSQLRVWLVTAGPGDAVWERYGHNAIRILDTSSGRDAAYNWGIFDFQQVDFIPRFLRGQMLYMMAPFQTQAMIDSYARANREVVLQELDLTPAEKLSLLRFVERNALPENRDYIYQYFLDNCSTRVRDVLDGVLNGALRARFESEPTGTTYRFHTRRLTQVDPFVYAGMDALLGTPTDEPISVWEEMFIPMTLRDEIRTVSRTDVDGVERPLVLSEEVVAASTRPPPPASPPRSFPVFLLLGVTLGAVFATGGRVGSGRRRGWLRAVWVLQVSWALLCGVLGTILVLLLFTDHTFAYWNENLFLFNPLALFLALLLALTPFGDRWSRRARVCAAIVLLIALAGWIWQIVPWSRHENAMFFALALPAHAGVLLAMLGVGSKRPISSEVDGTV
jgi:hypothetical protein